MNAASSSSVPDHHGRGGRVLFEIPFRSSMGDSDVAHMVRLLDLTAHMHHNMRPDPSSPGVARLDHYSGLYLERGHEQDTWVLEARTWGKPAPESVHEWLVLAALAARELDPRVRLPHQQLRVVAEIPDRPVASASGKRLAALRRHLAGVS